MLVVLTSALKLSFQLFKRLESEAWNILRCRVDGAGASCIEGIRVGMDQSFANTGVGGRGYSKQERSQYIDSKVVVKLLCSSSSAAQLPFCVFHVATAETLVPLRFPCKYFN